MCLAVPMKLLSITPEGRGVVDMEGVQTEVDLSLVENPIAGQYLIVHTGFAIEIMNEEQAAGQISLLKALGTGSRNQEGES